MFCSLTSLVIPTPKHDEVLNETPRIHHAARWRGRLAAADVQSGSDIFVHGMRFSHIGAGA
jgi:hypothetical protein